jgi:hypothetical protein
MEALLMGDFGSQLQDFVEEVSETRARGTAQL